MIQKETPPYPTSGASYRKITTVNRYRPCVWCKQLTNTRSKIYYPSNFAPKFCVLCPNCIEKNAQSSLAHGWEIEII